MFQGREEELGRLDSLYKSGKFETALVFGRRRIGKSAVVRQFVKDKRAVYFSAFDSSLNDNLEVLSLALKPQIKRGSRSQFSDISEIFYKIYELSLDERLVLVIDNYDVLERLSRTIAPVMNFCISDLFKKTKLMLILCVSGSNLSSEKLTGGTSLSSMTKIGLQALDFGTAAKLLGRQKSRAAALTYAATGGVPGYLDRFADCKDVREGLIRSFFAPSATFLHEESFLLASTAGDKPVYCAILRALSRGLYKNSQLAKRLDLKTDELAAYLRKLISMGFVEKFASPGSNKRRFYRICDPFLRFWYSFVYGHESELATLGAFGYYDSIKPQLDRYLQEGFVEIARQWLIRENAANRLPLPFTRTLIDRSGDEAATEGGDSPSNGDSPSSSESPSSLGSIKTELDSLKLWLQREAEQSEPKKTPPPPPKKPMKKPEKVQRPTSIHFDELEVYSSPARRADSFIDMSLKGSDESVIHASCIIEQRDDLVALEKLSQSSEDTALKKRRLYLLSLDEFSLACQERACAMKNVTLVSLRDMY